MPFKIPKILATVVGLAVLFGIEAVTVDFIRDAQDKKAFDKIEKKRHRSGR